MAVSGIVMGIGFAIVLCGLLDRLANKCNRFSTRTLFLAVTAIALLLGVIGTMMHF